MLQKRINMKWLVAASLLTLGQLALSVRVVESADFVLTQDKDGITVSRDGKQVTRYLTFSGAKPILWPVKGPYGDDITRGYPMRKALDTERDDHVHHRSFWFTHGNVNGIDFWSEGKDHGNIVHRKFSVVKGLSLIHI